MAEILDTTNAQTFLRIGTLQSVESNLLSILCDAAESWVQENMGVAIGAQEFIEMHDGGYVRLRPCMQPVTAVAKIEDVLRGEDVDPTLYTLDPDGTVRHECVWMDGPSRYKITYTAGWTAETAPKCLSNALLQIVHRMFHARGGLSASGVGDVSTTLESLNLSDIAQWLAPLNKGGYF